MLVVFAPCPQVLTRGREISKKQWSLVRVAVVSMVGSTYIGRIFFGSSSSEVLWDVDARPSELGSWLKALPAHACSPCPGRCQWLSAQPCMLCLPCMHAGDSIWLALKAQCPIYVAKHVWEAHATPLRELQEHKAQEQQAGAGEAADSDPIAIRCVELVLVEWLAALCSADP